MFVKPAPGLLVRDPRTGARMPEGGRHIDENDLEWARLLNFGDVVQAEQPAEPVKE